MTRFLFGSRRRIGAKLLLIILPCLLAGAVLMFLILEESVRHERVAALKARLDSFTVTQGASLAKEMWEFDSQTIDDIFRSYAQVPELAAAELRDPDGSLVAQASGGQVPADAHVFRKEIPLVQHTPDGDYVVGQLVAEFQDGFVEQEIRAQRDGVMAVMVGAFVLLAAVVLASVNYLVTRPLKRLRQSLHHNAVAESGDRLIWRGNDELADVVNAYNHLLGEIDSRKQNTYHRAYYDQLTGLPNRRLLADRLSHAISLAQRLKMGVAVLLFDLDGFKTINNTLGYEVGDALLKMMGERITHTVRSMDSVARWGGDEFVVLLEGIESPGEACSVAEKLIAAVGEPVQLGHNLLRVGTSLSICLYPQDGEDAATLMNRAEAALAEARAAGRNTLHFFDPTMNLKALRRLEMDEALREGIAANELELHYQPKVWLANQELMGLEALIRWRRPTEGLVPPSQFIPIAEESDLIVQIGHWVLKEVCAQFQRWRRAGYVEVPVAINLSPRHFWNPADIEELVAIVDRADVPPHMIEFELTEATVMGHKESTIELLNRLRNHGFGIAIDDFGTGYSNLCYLSKLPVTTLKIDRSFVQDLDQGGDVAGIVRAIIAMARTLDLKLVAEGVETAEQLAILKSMGCEVAQGFYFSRPEPAARLGLWLRRPNPSATPILPLSAELPAGEALAVSPG